jgi:hypothetical protein
MEIKEIETKKGYWAYDMEWVKVNNIPEWYAYNIHAEILYYLFEWKEIPNFDNTRNIITDLYLETIYIEYSDNNVRNKDIENYKKIKLINPFKSEKIDKSRQIALNIWDFEYNWKYYLVLEPLNQLTDETNTEKWLFRGVIVDYEKYYGANNDVKDEIKETSTKIEDLIK